MTIPSATLSSYWKSDLTSVNPALLSASWASSSLLPDTSGTGISFPINAELTTTCTVECFFTFVPVFVFCSLTVPSSYFSESSLESTLIPSFLSFSAFVASSSVIPTISGTFTVSLSDESSVVVPDPIDLKIPAAFPTAKIKINAMISATTIIRIFMTLFICGLTSSAPFLPS